MSAQLSKKLFGTVLVIILVTILVGVRTIVSPPENFPVSKTFLINEGEGIKSVSMRLEEGGFVRSALLFRVFLSGYNHDRKLQLGYYEFKNIESLPGLVHSIITNGPTYPFGKLTIPEGSTDKEVAELIHKELPTLSITNILSRIQSESANGFLFPETYYLVPSMDEQEIISRMQSMFVKKTKVFFVLESKVLSKEEKEKLLPTIILASILEGEANNSEDMKLVSGILEKRLQIGMALQVDVDPNTYKEKGLPKVPLNNPGLVALDAARNPTKSDYLYYITGKDGRMHYSKTYPEHKVNIKKYLK